MSHHDLQSCQLDRLNHRYLCVATAAFFNRIDPKPPTRHVCSMSAHSGQSGLGMLNRSSSGCYPRSTSVARL